MECSEVLEQLSDYLDAEAREELCRAIKEHLAQCHDCTVQVDTVKKTIVLYQSASRIDMPVHVSTQLQSALAREYDRSRDKSPVD